MKKFAILTAALTLSLLGLGSNEAQAAYLSTNLLQVQFQMTAVAASTNVIQTTNAAGAVTTIVKTVTSVLTTADILAMLETEYNTNFPTGAKLMCSALGPQNFAVTDATGHFLLDVSPTLSISNGVVKGPDQGISTYTGKTVLNAATTNYSEVVTDTRSDVGVFYKDSHDNAFHFVGIKTIKRTVLENSAGIFIPSATITLVGSGGGTFVKKGQQMTGVFTRAQMISSGRNIRNP